MVELETVEMSLDRRIRRLQEEPTTVKPSLVTDLNAAHMETQAMRKESFASTEAARREFQAQMEDVKARAEQGRGMRNGARAEKPPKFGGASPWTVFRREFETAAEYNCWTSQEISTHLIIALQDRVTDVLYRILKGLPYEEALQTLEDPFGDQQFAVVYRSRLKARTQRVGESLRGFATAIEQLPHRAYPTLPEDYKRREGGRASVDGVEDHDIKIHLLLGDEKKFSEGLGKRLNYMPYS
jgi:hypothetical protein